MKSYIFSILSAALFVAGVSAQLTVNTPSNVVVCQPLQIAFSSGTPPYFLSIHPGATPNDPPLVTFNNTITSSPFTWTAVNFPAGTSLDITIRDSTGASAQSAPFTVQAGGSTSCLNSTAAGSAAPAASTTSSATTTGTTSSATKAGDSGSGTSKAASPSSSSNAAIIAGIPYVVAGVLGAVVAAVFV